MDPRTHELLEAALAEYTMTLEAATSQDAATSFYRLIGARDYIRILLNLGEQTKPVVTPVNQQLEPV